MQEIQNQILYRYKNRKDEWCWMDDETHAYIVRSGCKKLLNEITSEDCQVYEMFWKIKTLDSAQTFCIESNTE